MGELDYIDEFVRLCTDAASVEDPALNFYVRAARGRKSGVLRAVFPTFMKRFKAQSKDLAQRYRDTDVSDPDWYRNARELLPIVDAMISTGELPAWSAALAKHEWTLFGVGLTSFDFPEESGSETRLNPSLDAIEYPYDLPRWFESSTPYPEHSPVNIGYYQHAQTLESRWIELTPARLAALRVVMEGLDPTDVAKLLGSDEDTIRTSIDQLKADGLIVENLQQN